MVKGASERSAPCGRRRPSPPFMTQRTLLTTAVDVGERVAFDGDDVGEVAGRDRAEVPAMAEQRGRNRRRGGERLRRRHAGLDEPAELARVLAEHRVDGVGSHPDLHARLERAARGLEVLLDVRLQRRESCRARSRIRLSRRRSSGCDRSSAPRPCRARHVGDRLVVQIDAVLDRIGAGAHGVFHAGGPIGMDRDRMILRVRGIDGRLHLFERQRLRRVDALIAAARAVDLDPVGAGGRCAPPPAADSPASARRRAAPTAPGRRRTSAARPSCPC